MDKGRLVVVVVVGCRTCFSFFVFGWLRIIDGGILAGSGLCRSVSNIDLLPRRIGGGSLLGLCRSVSNLGLFLGRLGGGVLDLCRGASSLHLFLGGFGGGGALSLCRSVDNLDLFLGRLSGCGAPGLCRSVCLIVGDHLSLFLGKVGGGVFMSASITQSPLSFRLFGLRFSRRRLIDYFWVLVPEPRRKARALLERSRRLLLHHAGGRISDWRGIHPRFIIPGVTLGSSSRSVFERDWLRFQCFDTLSFRLARAGGLLGR